MCCHRAVGMASGSLRICACIFSFKTRPEVAWAELLDLENRDIGIIFQAEVGNFFFFWVASFPLQSCISHFNCVCRPHLSAYRTLIKFSGKCNQARLYPYSQATVQGICQSAFPSDCILGNQLPEQFVVCGCSPLPH